MKKIASFIMSVALASSAFAGSVSYSGKSGKGVMPPVAPSCDAFAPGFSIGLNGTGFFPRNEASDYKNALGGGISGEYFFTENFGARLSYDAVATSGALHIFNGDIILRAPIKSICIAPYVLVGGGFSVDGEKLGEYHAGAGLEVHLKSLQNVNLFGEGSYNWHSSNNREADFTLVRLGIKFHL